MLLAWFLLPLTVTPTRMSMICRQLPCMHQKWPSIRPAVRSISVAVVVIVLLHGNKLARSISIGGMHRPCVHGTAHVSVSIQATRSRCIACTAREWWQLEAMTKEMHEQREPAVGSWLHGPIYIWPYALSMYALHKQHGSTRRFGQLLMILIRRGPRGYDRDWRDWRSLDRSMAELVCVRSVKVWLGMDRNGHTRFRIQMLVEWTSKKYPPRGNPTNFGLAGYITALRAPRTWQAMTEIIIGQREKHC